MQTRISAPHPALVQIGIAAVYQRVLFEMVEDLEKGKREAVEWFTNDRENVAHVARLAGFNPQSIFRVISDPLRDGVALSEIRIRVREARRLLSA